MDDAPSVAALEARLSFLTEADRLKSVTRASTLLDQSRHENSAEHSWQAALAGLIWLGDLPEAQLDRILAMLLLHDLVEIDAGDQPIDMPHDAAALARAEAAAADRLFAMLPGDQGPALRALWEEFESAATQDARLAKSVDFALPVLQSLAARPQRADHLAVGRENLATGRARLTAQTLPALHDYLSRGATGGDPQMGTHETASLQADPGDTARQCAFIAEADALKRVERATTLCDASRPENSAEHSWHLALYALVLADHAPEGVSVFRVIRMLLLHDLVEIDAGDAPIYAQTAESAAIMAEREEAAAERLFGLLPAAQGAHLHALWTEFEAAGTPDARFAKALDRLQPPLQNIASGGAGWRANGVRFEMVEARVGRAIQRSVPALWDHIAPQVRRLTASF